MISSIELERAKLEVASRTLIVCACACLYSLSSCAAETTLTATENEALEAQLSRGAPQLWKDNLAYEEGGWRIARHPRLLADVNGDSRDDVVGFGSAGVWVALSDGSSLGSAQIWVESYGFNVGGWRVARHPRFLADVNGDGKADVVGFGDAGVYVSLSTGSGFTDPALWVASYGFHAGWRVGRHPRFVEDINGDHRADIVAFGDDGVYVSLSTGSSFTDPALWVANYGYEAGGWRVDLHPRLLADANGDGQLDVIGFGIAGTYVSLSNGSSFDEPRLWIDQYGFGSGAWRPWHPRFAEDVNGDGRADIVGFGDAGTYVSLSTGSGFSDPALWVANYGSEAGGWSVERHPRFVRDIDADGRADIVGFGDAGVYLSYSNGTSFSEPELAVKSFGYEAGGWRVDKHPRLLGLMNADPNVDIVGFGDRGLYVSLTD